MSFMEDQLPTYQYACTECQHSFEQFQSFSDDALTVCPQCQGRLRKVFNAVGVVFKGSGFYRNDSRSADPNGKPDGKPVPAGESASGSGGDAGAKSGGDSAGDKKSSTEKAAAKTTAGVTSSAPKDSPSAA